MKKIMYFAAALLVLVGCQKSQEAKENAPANYGTITGKIELPQGPNKIAAPEGWEEEETAFTMVWESTDKIYIYNQSACKELTVKSIDEQTCVATFEGELLTDMSSYNVAYGYDPQATSTEFAVPYIAGNYRPFATGEGTDYTFTIANFEPVIGLQLKGDGAFSKIEVVLSNSSKETLATYTMTFADALTLTEEVTKVYFPIQAKEGAVKIAISFYKKVNSEEVLTLTKTTNMPEANKVTTFPVLTFQSAYEYVDLGLPSGLKWATCNVGATAPESYGDYFAWGEVEPYYSSQDPLTWKTGKESGYAWQSYCGQSSFQEWSTAPYDANKILLLTKDAAHVNWEGDWRMPTKAEFEELRTKCNWTWTQKNGINGYEVKGPNDNTIFLPTAGYRSDLSLYGSDRGHYWSSSLYEYSDPNNAYYLYFRSGHIDDGGIKGNRCDGLSVRPVCQ